MKICSTSMPLVAMVLLIGLSACSSSPDASSTIDQGAADPPSGRNRVAAPVFKDMTSVGADLIDDVDFPAGTATRTFVPWDSMAILEVSAGTEHDKLCAGALIVRYGKNQSVDEGITATIYLLEPAGPKIEPIALEWQPASGFELRAIARVDGMLRRYDFDR